MNHWNIAVAPMDGLEAEAARIRRRLSDAWDSSPTAVFRIVRIDELDERAIEQLDAVVLLADAGCKHTSLVRPLADLDELHVPVLALLDGAPRAASVFESSNVLVAGRSTDGNLLSARLHGLLHRQREVNLLRHEIAVTRLSHGGLGEEVTKMHEELQLAACAQRELLPELIPELHGVTVAALWRPAQYVSGDIYDVARLDDDHLGLFLADAVGHGVSAALMTMVITQSLTTRVRDGSSWRILDPAEVLTRLNAQMIGRRIHPSRFATAVYGVVDCRRRRMAIATAGHPPPFIVDGSGRSRTLETSGGLLGVFDDETYDQVEVDLEVGDRLLMYTDGFEQAFPQEGPERRRLPTGRYREEFEMLCEATEPREMIERIERRLDVQSGSLHQIDDLTLLCLHAGPLPAAEDAGKMAA